MMTVTPPIAVTPDDVWIFITAQATQAVEAARVAYAPATGAFIALPTEVAFTDAILPIFDNGELADGFRWATTDDVNAHADQFVQF